MPTSARTSRVTVSERALEKLSPKQQALVQSYFLNTDLINDDGRQRWSFREVDDPDLSADPSPVITVKWTDYESGADARLSVTVLENDIGTVAYTMKDPKSEMGAPLSDSRSTHVLPDWLGSVVKPGPALTKEMSSLFWPESRIPADATLRWRYKKTDDQESIKAKWFESAGVSKHRMLTVGGDYPRVTTGTSRRRTMTEQESSEYRGSGTSPTSPPPRGDTATGPKEVKARPSVGPLPSGSTPSSGTRGSRRAKSVKAILRR